MILLGIYIGRSYWPFKEQIKIETAHYTIYSTATQQQTILIGEASESLYAAYTDFFKDMIDAKEHKGRLRMRLYKDRDEFKAHNWSAPWAEAFYHNPYCYAYYPESEANPYHWMIHEGTHQLNREVAHFKVPEWIDEGLATYFGSSKIRNGRLQPGEIDVNTYPIWILQTISLTGNLQKDINNNKIIPLRALITGTGGPNIIRHFNLYYVHYWSLTHFLFHYTNGKYSDGYKSLIRAGGTLEEFEKRIGSVDRIQNEWYEYLRQSVSEV